MRYKTKKVLLITTDFGQGGLGKQSYLWLTKFKIVSKFVVFDVQESLSEVSKEGSRVISLNCKIWLGSKAGKMLYELKRVFCILKSAFYILSILKKEKPNIVISFSYIPNIYNIFSSYLNRHYAILVEHSYPKFDLNKSMKKRIFLKIMSSIYKISKNNKHIYFIAISKDIKRFYEYEIGIEPERVVYIPNAYDIHEILHKSQQPVQYPLRDFLDNIEYIINVGRLTKAKGQWYLLRIFSNLKRYIPNLKLLILGDGELKQKLVNLSENLGMKTFVWDRDIFSSNFDVYFLGYQENPFNIISKGRLFVLTSLWEGLPNVLIEALACQIPIISTDCKSGPRDILAPNLDEDVKIKQPYFADYGILMPEFSNNYKEHLEPLDEVERMWVETIKFVLMNPHILSKYKNKSLQRAYDFDIGKVHEMWENFIEDLADGKIQSR